MLALATGARAAGNSPPERFVISSDDPGANLYTYVGGSWWEGENGRDVFGIPFEARLIIPGDWELALETSQLAESGDGAGEFQSGDTILRAAKLFRPETCLDFVNIEYAEVLSKADAGLTYGVNRWLEIRGQGGYTRLGLNASASYLDLDESLGFGDHGYAISAGYRGQFGRWHLGIDYVRTELESPFHIDTIDLAVMRRTYRGNSFYGLIQKGVSDFNEAWYFNAGYEFKFSY